jgi:ABC-2 type transport system permease protein
MSIRKLAAVARREYIETVKTKAFLFGVLLMPAIIVGMIFLSAKMSVEAQQHAGPIRVAIVDPTGRVAGEMMDLADQAKQAPGGQVVQLEPAPPTPTPEQLAQLKARVRDGSLFCIVEVPDGVLSGKGACTVYVRDVGFDDRPRKVHQLLNEAVKRIRLADAGLDPRRVEQLSRPVTVDLRGVIGQAGRPSEAMANMMTPFAFVFLMFMGVFGVAQGLLTSVIEEKSSRVVEVLLSALSPFELMAGKILGMAAVGLTMVTIWAAVGYGAAVWQDVQQLVQVAHVGQFILYYALGYLLISSILAAVGSACNTLKEAQPMLTPLTLLLVIPMLFWMQIVTSPNSALSVALSFVPPMTPFVMVLRLSALEAGTPIWQQVFVPLWLAGWVLATMWAAGRVFRVGLLMYGRPPGLRQMARWVLYR